MSLTHEDLALLSKPFPAKVHKFLGGLPYLHEEPVGMRLDMVDPSWSWEIVKIERRANAGEGGKDVGTVVAHGRLTVGGVSRDGIGMATIQQTNPIEKEKWENGTKKKTGEFYTNEANEAEKSAATDAFKRAFRMFGGGRYLLTIPKDEKGKLTVQNITQLDKWLKDTYGEIEDVPTFHDEDSAEDTTPANVSQLPQVDNHTAPWTKEQADAFGKAWQKEGYKTPEILEILAVKRLGEWKKSLWDANEVMNKAMAQGF